MRATRVEHNPFQRKPVTLELVPLSQRDARRFVVEHHRHNDAPQGDVIRVGLELNGDLVAVATAGRPIAAGLQDGRSLEITRVCVAEDEFTSYPNACSRLYGALARAAKALGYRTLWTYTLEAESGVSPRAAGFVLDGVIEERDWSAESGRDRYESNLFGERTTPAGPKRRWRRDL